MAFSRRFSSFLALASVVTLSRCSCDEVLGGLPTPQIEVLDAADNSHLEADPWLVVNLGDADSGSTAATTLTIKNTGTGSLELLAHCFVVAETLAEAKEAACTSGNVPFSFDPFAGTQVKAAGSISVGVRFSPTAGGPATTFLQIRSTAQKEPVVAIQLVARGTDGRLCAEPDGRYDFGDVNVGVTVQAQLTLRNCGVKPISIDSFAFDRNPHDAFGVLIAGNPPVAPIGPIAENDTIVLDVSFTPQQPFAYRDTNAGLIAVTTGPEFPGQYTLQLEGNGVVPPSCQIRIFPDTGVDFGAVASNTTATRQMIVQSVGQCGCSLISISDPLPSDAGFALGALPALPLTLKGTVGCDGDPADAAAAPSSLTVDVLYTSPDRQTPIVDNATLDVTTSDPVTPVRNVPLQANGGGEPFCQLAVTPEGSTSPFDDATSNRYGIIEFGRTSVFGEKSEAIRLENIGNIDCHVTQVRYDDPDNTVANEFRVETADGQNALTAPDATIAPGQAATYFAIFAPTHVIEGGSIFSFGQYSGSISLETSFLCGLVDPNERCNGVTFVTDDLLTVFDEQGAGWGPGEVSIGFSATPVEPDVEVIPGELDFGLVTLGCGSPEQRVTVYNTGSADLIVGQPRIEPVANPVNFVIEGTSNIPNTWPYTIAPGSSLAILVRYHAEALAVETGSLVIPTFEGANEGPPVTVPLRGEGTNETEHTDIFDQFDDPKVDVLWVVDDSGSMAPFQDLLANNFGQFFTASNVDDADYHIAVTSTLTADSSCVPAPPFCSTDADCGAGGQCVLAVCTAGTQVNSCPDDPMSGHYTVGAQGNDRYLTPASVDAPGQFSENVRVSNAMIPSRSASDSAEGGFRAAFNFLSAPKIDDPVINGGFLRDDAKLHVIMVSDEPEQSKGPVDLYIDFFKNLKGFRNDGLVAVSAIASPAAGCTFSDGTQLPGDPRYETLVDELNGRFQNICETDWSGMMQNLGLDSLGLRIEFLLSRAAQQGAIDVCVRATPAGACVAQTETTDGAANGWFYDPVANSVVFNPGSVPPAGSRVEVHYSTFCF